MGADPETLAAAQGQVTRRAVIGAFLAVAACTLASDDRSHMSPASEWTGPEVYDTAGDGHHRHLVTTPAAPVTPVTPVAPVAPVAPAGLTPIPAETAVGSGAMATAWGEAILTALGAPLSTANVASMLAWFAAEDDNQQQGSHADGAGGSNPLDVTADSGTFAGVTGSEPSGAGPGYPGNLDFSPPSAGVAAMAQVIRNYGAIYSALMSGVGLINNPAVSAALSEWSGGGYSALT